MPFFEYVCHKCKIYEERLVHFSEFDEKAHSQVCDYCGGTMQKLVSVPNLHTDTEFMGGGQDDGFGADNRSRQVALRKARAAGVNVSGKRFNYGLCRKGVPFDPQAWYGSKSEVIQKLDRLGRHATGLVEHRSSIRDELAIAEEEPYRPSASCVRDDVEMEIEREHGGRVKPRKKRELYEKYIDRFSGRKR